MTPAPRRAGVDYVGSVVTDSRRTQCGPRMVDARGRPVGYLDPYELQLLRRSDVIPGDVLAPIVAEVGFGLPKWQKRGYTACVFLFFACVLFLIIWKIVRRVPIDSVEYILWPTNLVVFAFGAAKFWQSGRRARAKRICGVMLDHERCPHCGYDLRGLPADPVDGATVCPECGCAWLLHVSAAQRTGGRQEAAPSAAVANDALATEDRT